MRAISSGSSAQRPAGDSPLEPRQFEVSFGMERSAPELQRGLELGDGIVLSGKIDRIDIEPLSARGIVQDYKAGKHAPSAREMEKELRLQIPLYMLVMRDLVGIEPLGGLYRPLAGGRRPRGLLRERREGRRSRRLLQERLPGRGRVLGAGGDGAVDGARARRKHPSRQRPAQPEGRRVPLVVRPLADVPGGPRMTSHTLTHFGAESGTARGDRGEGTCLRLRGRRHREDGSASRAIRAGGLRRGSRRRLHSRDHVHEARCRRVAGARPRRAPAPRSRRSCPRARRCLDLHDPRLL